jgi:hypothetical protein
MISVKSLIALACIIGSTAIAQPYINIYARAAAYLSKDSSVFGAADAQPTPSEGEKQILG